MPTALIQADTLMSPTVGTFSPATVLGGPIRAGMLLGTIHQAGERVDITVPEGIAGAAISLTSTSWVQCGDALCQVGEGTGGVFEAPVAVNADVPDGCSAVCADTDGTVYLKPDPSSPDFVSVGDTVPAGTTLALVEVMKTFTPVRAENTADIVEVRVRDGGSVEAGDVLFVIR